MAETLISWEQLCEQCPRQCTAISNILDEYTIELNAFFRGISGDMDWHDVVNLRDCHLEIGEMDEAKLEDKLVAKLEEEWDVLHVSYKFATESAHLCRCITDIVFQNEFNPNEKALFKTELVSAVPTITKLVKSGETVWCEFKSTLRLNLHTNQNDKQMEHACLKTIAAFLNSHGGYLLIGVNDDGVALGLEKDGFPNEDKMNLHLVNVSVQDCQ